MSDDKNNNNSEHGGWKEPQQLPPPSNATTTPAPEALEEERSLERLTALWDNTNSKPIMNHNELGSLLAKHGFLPKPLVAVVPSFSPAPAPDHDPYNVAWKEYYHTYHTIAGESRTPWPCPRLPYPRIDGLHVKTYELFIHFVGICIGAQMAQAIFHVREIAAATASGKSKEDEFDFDERIGKWYRKGCLDGFTEFFCQVYKIDGSTCECEEERNGGELEAVEDNNGDGDGENNGSESEKITEQLGDINGIGSEHKHTDSGGGSGTENAKNSIDDKDDDDLQQQ